MRLKEMIQDSFRGGMNHAGTGKEDFSPEQVHYIKNGLIDRDGCIRMRRPILKATPNPIPNGGSAGSYLGTENWGCLHLSLATPQLLSFFGQKLYKSTNDGANWTAVAGAVGLTENFWSCTTMEAAGALYGLFANGSGLYSYDGAAWAAVAGCPINPHFIAVFNGRLWAARNDSNKVYASKIDDFTVWTTPDGLVLPVNTQDGERVMGLLGLNNELLVFKKHTTSSVDGFGNSDIVVASGSKGASGSVGCVAFRSAVACGDYGACWLSERGVELYVPGGQIKLISTPVARKLIQLKWNWITTQQASLTLGGNVCATFNAYDNEYRLYVPDDSSYTYACDAAYRFNFTFGCWAMDDYFLSIATSGGVMSACESPYTAGLISSYVGIARTYVGTRLIGLGVVLNASGTSNLDFGSGSYEFEVKGPVWDFGDSTKRKVARELVVTIEPVQATVNMSTVAWVADPGRVDESLENDGVAGTVHLVTFNGSTRLTPITMRTRISVRCRRGYYWLKCLNNQPTNVCPTIIAVAAYAQVFDNRF